MIRVLLADDHKILRQGLAGLLREEKDIELVGEACDGLMAVEMARRLRPDVVVMDISMPRLNGIEATRIINQDPRTKEVPIICATALAMPQDRDRCIEAGARAYLSKPFDMGQLFDTMRRLMPDLFTQQPGFPGPST